MEKIIYIAVIGYLLYSSLLNVILNPIHARSKGYAGWANRIPNYIMLVFMCAYLAIYPFTELPYRYSQLLSISLSQQYIILTFSPLPFHMITIGITGIRRSIKSGKPTSFVARYIHLFVGKKPLTDPRDGADILLAEEYAVVGAAGGLYLSANYPEISAYLNPIAVFFIAGSVFCMCYCLVAKVWQAQYY